MKKSILVLALSISAATVFAQDASNQVQKAESQAVAPKGKLMHKLKVNEAQNDNHASMSGKEKLEVRKETVANPALMKTAAEPKAVIRENK